ncbi:hypothetical protein [uncultured Clostridium sp.]|uniref:hypothetical protein n=1 Tax=uncultured Clostridium sp. TaxID=59620 RepID=UPI00260744BC|nr:hypothetical protein [uncultured Clostridium sp.]
MKKLLFGIILSVAILFVSCGKGDDIKPEVENNTNVQVSSGYSLQFGELLENKITEFGDKKILIVKAKIEPSFSNKTTISQNGYNIEDLIIKQGADQFDEIQYWAVADMESGNEDKVISFTVNKEMIEKIKNKEIVGNQIVDKAIDVWILPSLL